MAFHFFRCLAGKGNGEAQTVTLAEWLDLFADACIRDLAFESCCNLMANAISKCELKIYRNHEEFRGAEYYLWNIEPNQNQSSSAFWHKLIHQLYRYRTALVVEHGGHLYVADSFARKPYALYEDLFTDVTVGDFTFHRSFNQSDVLYFELTAADMKRITDGLYDSYGKLIAYGMKGYQRSRGEKGVLELDATAHGDEKFNQTFEQIKNDGFRKFAEAENAVLPMWKGMKYNSLGSKTYNADTTRDIRAMIDDVVDFTARGFCIPAVLVNGTVQDVGSAVDQLLTFAVDPLVDNLAEEINRKRYGKAAVLSGNFVRFDTSQIRHVDILEQSGNISKLVGSGVECVNDIRALLGQPIINEPWAWEHFMTKNFATAADLLEALEKEREQHET